MGTDARRDWSLLALAAIGGFTIAGCGGGGGSSSGGTTSNASNPATVEKTTVEESSSTSTDTAGDVAADSVETVQDTSGDSFKATVGDDEPFPFRAKSPCATITADAGSTQLNGGFTVNFGSGCPIGTIGSISGSLHVSYAIVVAGLSGTVTTTYTNLTVTRGTISRTRNGSISVTVTGASATSFTTSTTFQSLSIADGTQTVTMTGTVTANVTANAQTKRAVTVVVNSTDLRAASTVKGYLDTVIANVTYDLSQATPCRYPISGTVTLTNGTTAAVITYTGCNTAPTWSLNGVAQGQLTPPGAQIIKATVKAFTKIAYDIAQDIAADATETVLDTSGNSFKAGEVPGADRFATTCATFTIDQGSTATAGGFTVDFASGCTYPNGVVVSGSLRVTYAITQAEATGTVTVSYGNFTVTKSGQTLILNGGASVTVNKTGAGTFDEVITFTDLSASNGTERIALNGSINATVTATLITEQAATVTLTGGTVTVTGSANGYLDITFNNVVYDVQNPPCQYPSSGTLSLTNGQVIAVVTYAGCSTVPTWTMNAVPQGNLD